jgi:hypothetical protein
MQEALRAMTQLEDPVTTVIRLLQKNIRLVKDDGSLGSVYVSKEWYDQQLMKNFDAQVTVGLDRADDKKLNLSGSLRRRMCFLKGNAWSANRDIREKLREEINRVIREKRKTPNVTDYDFWSVGPPTGTHKAYHAASDSELPPGDVGWVELSAEEYQKLWYSDDSRYSYSQSENGKYSLILFRFKTESKKNVVKKIVLSFEGYGTAPGGNGITVKVWNFDAEAWQNAQAGTGDSDETIIITLSSSLTDYVDSEGYVYLLARTTNPSDGDTAAIIYCDYVLCSITVNGITYCDVVSYRDLDQVRVKPFLWRTEFMVKTWLIERVLGG